MKRWDIFRGKRDQFIDYYVGLKNRKNRSKFLVTALVLDRMLRYLAGYYNDMRNEALLIAVQNYKCFQMQFRTKRLLLKRGPTIKHRTTKTLQK